MAVRFHCDQCQFDWELPCESGSVVRCPRCGVMIVDPLDRPMQQLPATDQIRLRFELWGAFLIAIGLCCGGLYTFFILFFENMAHEMNGRPGPYVGTLMAVVSATLLIGAGATCMWRARRLALAAVELIQCFIWVVMTVVFVGLAGFIFALKICGK